MRRHPLEAKRILLDCRWLGIGGIGRATELLLLELRHAAPPDIRRAIDEVVVAPDRAPFVLE